MTSAMETDVRITVVANSQIISVTSQSAIDVIRRGTEQYFNVVQEMSRFLFFSMVPELLPCQRGLCRDGDHRLAIV